MEIATKTQPNGITAATDLAPFAAFVKGTVRAARWCVAGNGLPDRWSVDYITPKGIKRNKYVAASKVGR
jgi:hypothetical protein